MGANGLVFDPCRLSDAQVSQLCFFCLLWPDVPESDIAGCMEWCKVFAAKGLVARYISSGESLNQSSIPEDLDLVYDILGLYSVDDFDAAKSFPEFAECSILFASSQDVLSNEDIRD